MTFCTAQIFSCPAQVLWIILILSRCRPHCSTVYRPINPSIVEMDRTWTEARSRYLLQRLYSLWIFVVCREFHVRARRNQHEKVNIPSFFVNLIISHPSHLFIMLLYFFRIFFLIFVSFASNSTRFYGINILTISMTHHPHTSMWYLPEMSILYFDVRCSAESARSQTTYLADDHACLVEWKEEKNATISVSTSYLACLI